MARKIFRDFQLEILSESERTIEAKMKGIGAEAVSQRPKLLVTKEEYIRFFAKKWEAIAGYLDLEYQQRAEEDWIVFSVTAKRQR